MDDGNKKGPTNIQKNNENRILSNITEFLKSAARQTATIGKYTILEELGHGGTSNVFKAFDKSLKRHVALKMLYTPSLGAQRRFKREAEIIATLKHPNIVPVYEISSDDGKNFIAMEYIEGETLDELAPEMEITHIIKVFINICDALEHAHSRNVIHRDIKPQNIIIDKNAGAHLVDFGIAKERDSMLTKTNEIIGTPEFMAPEQINGEATDARTDIYCLGSTLYHSLTNKPPFTGQTAIEAVSNTLGDEVTPPSTLNPLIPNTLDSIVLKCLEKRAEYRYQEIRALKNDLQNALENTAVNVTGIPLMRKIARAVRRKQKQLMITIILLAAAIVLIYLTRPSPSELRSLATPIYEKAVSQLDSIKSSTTGAIRKNLFSHMKDTAGLFTKAIDQDPYYTEAYLGRGRTYSLMTDYKSALKDFSKAVELNPGSTEGYYERILCRARILVYNSTKQRNRKIREGIIGSMKDDLESIKNLDAAPSKIMCAEVVIKMYEQEYNYEYLSNRIKDAIGLDPLMEEAHYFSATLNYKKSVDSHSGEEARQYAGHALNDIENAIKINPNMIEYYLLYSQIASNVLQDYDDALDHIAEAKKLLPEGLWIQLTEASIYVMKEDHNNALEALRKTEGNENSIANREYRIDFFLERGTLKLILGLNDLANEDFDKAVKMAPDDVKDNVEEEIKMLKNRYLR